jgi:hypothetical protein
MALEFMIRIVGYGLTFKSENVVSQARRVPATLMLWGETGISLPQSVLALSARWEFANLRQEVSQSGHDSGTGVPLVSFCFHQFAHRYTRARRPCHYGGAQSQVRHSPSFLNRASTSLKWKSSEQSCSNSPFLKYLATSGSDFKTATKSASSRPACLTSQVFIALRCTNS